MLRSLITPILVASIFLAFGARCVGQDEGSARNVSLRNTLEGADRITVNDTAGCTDEHNRPIDLGPLAIIEGPNVAKDFVESCEFSSAEILPRCFCEGEVRVCFYTNKKLLAELYFHEYWRVDWQNGPYKGQLQLTTKGQAAIRRWLLEHGAAQQVARIKERKPNQALLPTTTAVTPPAGQEPRQP